MITEDTIGVIVDGEHKSISKSNPQAAALLRAISDGDVSGIKIAVDRASAIQSFSKGNIKVVNGVLFYKDSPLHGTVADRVLAFMQERQPVGPLLAFIEKLMLNPSLNSREQLYTFLAHHDIKIAEDGDFLAYKGIRDDWYSCTSGSLKLSKGKTNEGGYIFNGIGEEIIVDRSQVDDNPNHHCSKGLHVGTYNYASSFGPKCVIVKVNPADVVSVPTDCACQKVRTARYTVVATAFGALNRSLESSDRSVLESPELRARLQQVQSEVNNLQAEIEQLQEALRSKAASNTCPCAHDLPSYDETFGPFTVVTDCAEVEVRRETNVEDLFGEEIQEFMRASETAGLNVTAFDADGNEVDLSDVLDN